MKTQTINVHFLCATCFVAIAAASASDDLFNVRTVRRSGPFNTSQKVIHFGAPITMDPTKKFFNYGRWAMNSWDHLCDWVNNVKGGLKVGSETYKVKMTYMNDNSDKATAVAVAKYLAEKEKVDFMIAPYSSGSTGEVATHVTEPRKMVLAAAMAASTSKFVGKQYLFGTLVPSNTYMTAVMKALQAKHSQTSSSKLKVGYFTEDASFTKGVCSGVTTGAAAIGLELENHGIVTVTKDASSTELATVIEGFKNRSVDVVFGCTYYSTCVRFVQESKKLDFSPKAITLSACVDNDNFMADLGEDAKYILGPATWYKGQSGLGEKTNFTSPGWNTEYLKRYTEAPPYQAASAFTAPSVLMDAIERTNSLDSTVIMNELRKSDYKYNPFYGAVTFDANMQNAGEMKVIQHQDSSGSGVVTYPAEFKSGDLVFPMPTWAKRACMKSHNCHDHGACQDDGTCVCSGDFIGANCKSVPITELVENDTWLQEKLDSSVLYAVIAFCGIFGILTIALMLFYKANGKKYLILKASSLTFLQLMLFSHLLGFVAAVTYAVEASETICSIRPWLLTCSLIGVFSPLFAKTSRLYRLFNNTKMKRRKITDGDLFKQIGTHLLINCAIIAVWFASDRPELEKQKTKDDHTVVTKAPYLETTETFHHWHNGCTQGGNPMVQVLVVYFVMLIGYGCYMCYKSTGLPSEFNESRSIAQINYFVVMFGALILVIQYLIPANITALAVVRGFGICLGHVTVLLLLHGPKLSAIKSGAGNAKSTSSATAGTVTSVATSRNTVTPELQPANDQAKDKEIENLRKKLAEAEKKLKNSADF